MDSPYAPPQTLEPEKIGEQYEVALPGVSSKVVVVRNGAVGKRDLLVDGKPAPKKFPAKRLIKNDAGEILHARLQEGLSGTALVNRYPIGPQISKGLGILAFLPLACVAMGGAVGGFFGFLGMMSNRKIAHSDVATPLKVVGMLAVTLLSALIVLIVASAVHQAAS